MSSVSRVQGYTFLRSYRYERKFLVEDLQTFQVAMLIKQHPLLFHAPYPPRFVNNLYLDTPGMDNYYDNVNGAMQRRKVRVRWYGAPFGIIEQPMLEIKIKEGLVGTKHTYPLTTFSFESGFREYILQKTLSESPGIPPEVRFQLRFFNAVLFNRYFRHYYASRDGHFRLTLDTNLAFYNTNGGIEKHFTHRQQNYRELVVELKYDVEHEPQANRAAGFFPFRVTRSSKYVQGIERVFY